LNRKNDCKYLLYIDDHFSTLVRDVLDASGVSPAKITGLMIGPSPVSLEDVTSLIWLHSGTTHFINAGMQVYVTEKALILMGSVVVESDANRLAKVAVLRLAGPYTAECPPFIGATGLPRAQIALLLITNCPPFIDFPKVLRSIVAGHHAYLKGGLQIDGSAIDEIDEAEVVAECAKIKEKNLSNIAVVGVYSPLDRDGSSQEERVRDILLRELGPSTNVVCSRDGKYSCQCVNFLELKLLQSARSDLLRGRTCVPKSLVPSFISSYRTRFTLRIHALGHHTQRCHLDFCKAHNSQLPAWNDQARASRRSEL
jgi:hypothetical protein